MGEQVRAGLSMGDTDTNRGTMGETPRHNTRVPEEAGWPSDEHGPLGAHLHSDVPHDEALEGLRIVGSVIEVAGKPVHVLTERQARWIGGPELRDSLNLSLHDRLGIRPACRTACTHIVHGEWTALGIANVAARRLGASDA